MRSKTAFLLIETNWLPFSHFFKIRTYVKIFGNLRVSYLIIPLCVYLIRSENFIPVDIKYTKCLNIQFNPIEYLRYPR